MDMLNDGKSYFSEKLLELQSLYKVSFRNMTLRGVASFLFILWDM